MSQATSSALHLSLAARTKHCGMYGGRLQICLSPASLLRRRQACGGPQLSPASPLHRLSQHFASAWVGLLQGEYVQRLGLENQPLPVPAHCCKLTFSLWQLRRSGRQTGDQSHLGRGASAGCVHQTLPSASHSPLLVGGLLCIQPGWGDNTIS